MRYISKIIVIFAVLSLSLSSPSFAGSTVAQVPSGQRVNAKVIKDDAIMLRSETAFKEVRVGNPAVADVVILSDKSFQVLGKVSGKTNVMLYDTQQQLIDIIDVRVGHDVLGLKQALYEMFPKEPVEVREMAGGIYLSGKVSTAVIGERVEQIAQAYAPEKVTNGLVVKDSHQVLLEVRFVEASRDTLKELGIGILSQRAGDFGVGTGNGLISGLGSTLSGVLNGGIGAATLDVQIDALENKGVIRTLAEPNLVAMSGETASFLAGGEFPVPVQSDLGRVTIEFRQFGVGLAFTPTVLDDGIINLRVAPEVSQLDTTNSVRVGGVEVPSLSVRRANTTVELRNDQSFAIAGLLQNTTIADTSQVPWLGDVPVLGALFRSTRYKSQETELVIIITPRLVHPAADISDLATPLDGVSQPSDIDQFLMGKIETRSAAPLSTEYGHALQ